MTVLSTRNAVLSTLYASAGAGIASVLMNKGSSWGTSTAVASIGAVVIKNFAFLEESYGDCFRDYIASGAECIQYKVMEDPVAVAGIGTAVVIAGIVGYLGGKKLENIHRNSEGLLGYEARTTHFLSLAFLGDTTITFLDLLKIGKGFIDNIASGRVPEIDYSSPVFVLLSGYYVSVCGTYLLGSLASTGAINSHKPEGMAITGVTVFSWAAAVSYVQSRLGTTVWDTPLAISLPAGYFIGREISKRLGYSVEVLQLIPIAVFAHRGYQVITSISG